MEWYKNWFDSKYYHILYKNRNHKEAENFIQNLFQHLNIPKGSNLLDLACGKGRHSVFMNQFGYKVTGLDLSENSIMHAKKYKNQDLEFHVWDMRKIFKESAFNGIFNFFTSFGYFSDVDNETIFHAINQQLKPKGVFVLDFMNVKKVKQNLVKEEIKIENEIQFHLKRYVEDGKINKEIRFNAENKDWFFKEEVRLLELEQFLLFAKKSGLQHLTTFGNYHLDEFRPSQSNRLILVFQKE